MSYENHGRRHRPKSRGGTDPIEVILPYAQWSRSVVMPADSVAFTGSKAFGFETVSRYETRMFDIETGGAVDEAAASISDDGAAVIAAPGLYLIHAYFNDVTPNNSSTVINCALYSRYPSTSYHETSEGAPFLLTPLSRITGPFGGGAGLMYWLSVGHITANKKLWLKPIITITGTADTIGGMTMTALRVSDDSPMTTKIST